MADLTPRQRRARAKISNRPTACFEQECILIQICLLWKALGNLIDTSIDSVDNETMILVLRESTLYLGNTHLVLKGMAVQLRRTIDGLKRYQQGIVAEQEFAAIRECIQDQKKLQEDLQASEERAYGQGIDDLMNLNEFNNHNLSPIAREVAMLHAELDHGLREAFTHYKRNRSETLKLVIRNAVLVQQNTELALRCIVRELRMTIDTIARAKEGNVDEKEIKAIEGDIESWKKLNEDLIEWLKRMERGCRVGEEEEGGNESGQHQLKGAVTNSKDKVRPKEATRFVHETSGPMLQTVPERESDDEENVPLGPQHKLAFICLFLALLVIILCCLDGSVVTSRILDHCHMRPRTWQNCVNTLRWCSGMVRHNMWSVFSMS